MSICLFANNANSTLAGAITNTALTANLAAGSGVLFPAPGANQYFCMTFQDAATGLLNEIVHVTNVTGDTITMVRAQEGTTAKAWGAGDVAANLMTAGTAVIFAQPEQLQAQAGNYAVDTGSANAVSVTFSTAPANLAAMTGGAFRIKKSGAANTGAVTIAANGFTATALIHGDGTAVASGELPANGVFTTVYNGTAFVLQSTATPGGLTSAQLQIQGGNYAADTGSANGLVATLSPVPASLASLVGAPIRILKSSNANTGAVTLTLNGFTTTAVVQPDGSSLQAGNLPASGLFSVNYDGSHFVLQTFSYQSGTTAVPGLAELATDAETKALTSSTVVITPSNLGALSATTTQAGILETATQAEAQALSSTAVALTPDSLNGLIFISSPIAVPTSGTTGAVTHGLGLNVSVDLILQCTGTEAGYAVGQQVPAPGWASNSGESRGMSAKWTASSISAIVGSSGFTLPNATTGAAVSLATGAGVFTNWELIIKCSVI